MQDLPPIIPAGTQVVSRIEVRGSQGACVHPRGAVGIITRTPCGHETHYLVRFPDGFEASLVKDQLDVLKQFKDRLGKDESSISFDLEPCVIYRCIVGSRAYGLDTDSSDTDMRGIYLAPADMQWSLFGAPGQFEDNASQVCYWELQKFIVMALRANPNILECLYSPLVEKATPLAQKLLDVRQSFLSQMIFQTFNGYALSQFKKIEQDLRNHGQVKWKHAMHLLRLLITGASTLREQHVPVHVGRHRDELLAVKHGERTWEQVAAWRLALHRDFEQALAETKLPERPDYEAANVFLIESRRQGVSAIRHIKKELRFLERLAESGSFAQLVKRLGDAVDRNTVDKVVAIEALGFPLGGAIAQSLQKDLVLLRKEGDIPEEEIEHFVFRAFTDHSKQEKTFRLLLGALKPGDRVVLVDEHSDSGSQIRAAGRLVEEVGGVVVHVLLASADSRARFFLCQSNCPWPVTIFEEQGSRLSTHSESEWRTLAQNFW